MNAQSMDFNEQIHQHRTGLNFASYANNKISSVSRNKRLLMNNMNVIIEVRILF